MEFDFVYADLKVQVIFKADNDTVYGQLTDNEVMILQQQIYVTLTCFSMTRGFFALDKLEEYRKDRLSETERSPNG